MESTGPNISKYALYCSPNMAEPLRQEIAGLLHVPLVDSHDRYLGLPTLVGKNKRATFNIIKEKVWSKLQGWKGSLFSKGGKEVLLKSVVQALPAFYMSVFRIPEKVCSELNSLASNFWWGSSAKGKKLHWLK